MITKNDVKLLRLDLATEYSKEIWCEATEIVWNFSHF